MKFFEFWKSLNNSAQPHSEQELDEKSLHLKSSPSRKSTTNTPPSIVNNHRNELQQGRKKAAKSAHKTHQSASQSYPNFFRCDRTKDALCTGKPCSRFLDAVADKNRISDSGQLGKNNAQLNENLRSNASLSSEKFNNLVNTRDETSINNSDFRKASFVAGSYHRTNRRHAHDHLSEFNSNGNKNDVNKNCCYGINIAPAECGRGEPGSKWQTKYMNTDELNIFQSRSTSCTNTINRTNTISASRDYTEPENLHLNSSTNERCSINGKHTRTSSFMNNTADYETATELPRNLIEDQKTMKFEEDCNAEAIDRRRKNLCGERCGKTSFSAYMNSPSLQLQHCCRHAMLLLLVVLLLHATCLSASGSAPPPPRLRREAQLPVHLSANSFPLNGGLFLPPAPLPPLTPTPSFFNARQLPHFNPERNILPFNNPNFFVHGNHKIQSPVARLVGAGTPFNAPLDRPFHTPRPSDRSESSLRGIHHQNFDPNTFHPPGSFIFRHGHPVGDFRPISEILNDQSNVFGDTRTASLDHLRNDDFHSPLRQLSLKNQGFPFKNSFSSRIGIPADSIDFQSQAPQRNDRREDLKISNDLENGHEEFEPDESITIVKFPSHRLMSSTEERLKSNLESSKRISLPPELSLSTQVQISDVSRGTEVASVVLGKDPGQELLTNHDWPNTHQASRVNAATESNLKPSLLLLSSATVSISEDSFSPLNQGRTQRRRPQSKFRVPSENRGLENESAQTNPNIKRRNFRKRRLQKRPPSNSKFSSPGPKFDDTIKESSINLNTKTPNAHDQTPIDRSDDNIYEDYYDELALADEDYLYDYFQYYDEFKSILDQEEKSEKINSPAQDEQALKVKDENEFLISSEPTYTDDLPTPTTNQIAIEKITENPEFKENLRVTTESPEEESFGTSVSTSTEKTIEMDLVTEPASGNDEVTTENDTDYDDSISADELHERQNGTIVDYSEGNGNATEEERELSQREEEIVSAAEKHRQRLKEPPPKSGRGSFRHRLNLLTQKRKEASQTRDWSPTPSVPLVSTKPTSPRLQGNGAAPGFITGPVVVRNATQASDDEPLDFYTRLKYRIFTSPAPATSQRRSETRTASDDDESLGRAKLDDSISGKRESLQRERKTNLPPNTSRARTVRRQALSRRNNTLFGVRQTTTSTAVPITEEIDESKDETVIGNVTDSEEKIEAEESYTDSENNTALRNAGSLNESHSTSKIKLERENEPIENESVAQSAANMSSTEKEKSILNFLNNLSLHDLRGDTSNNNENDKVSIENEDTTVPSPVYVHSSTTTTQSSDSSTETTKSANEPVVRTTRETTTTTEVNFETHSPNDATDGLETNDNRKEISGPNVRELNAISSPSSVFNLTPLTEKHSEVRPETSTPSSKGENISTISNARTQLIELGREESVTSFSSNENDVEVQVEGRSLGESNISNKDVIPATIIQNIISRASVINGTDETPKLLIDVLKDINSSTLNVEQRNGTTLFSKIKLGNGYEPAVQTTITLFTDKFHKINPTNSASTENDFITTLDPIDFETQTNIPALQTNSIFSVGGGTQGWTESSDYTTYSSSNDHFPSFRIKSDASTLPPAYNIFTTPRPANQGQSSLSRLQNLLNQFDSSFRPEVSLNQFFGIASEGRIAPTPSSRFNVRPKTQVGNRAWSRPNNSYKNSFVDWTNPRGGRPPVVFSSFASAPQALTNPARHSLLSSSLDDLSLAASEGSDVNSENPTERSNITTTTQSSVLTSTSPDTADNDSSQSTSAIITSLVNDLFSTSSTSPVFMTSTVTTESYATDTEPSTEDIEPSTEATEFPPEVATQLSVVELTEEDLKLMEKSNITSIDVEKLLNDTSNSTVPSEFLEEIIEMTKGRLTSEVNNTDEATSVTLQLKQFLLKQRERDSEGITEEEENSFIKSKDEFLSSDAVRERLRLLRIFKAKKEREAGGRTIQKHLRKVKGATKVYQRTDDVDFEDIGVRVSTAVKLRDILNRRHQKKKKEVTTEAVKATTITPPPSLRSQIEKYMNRNKRQKDATSRPRYENVVKVNGFRVVKNEEEEEEEGQQEEDNTPTTEADEEMIFSQGTQASISQDFIPDKVSRASFLPTVPPGDRGGTMLQLGSLFSRENSRNLKPKHDEVSHSGQIFPRRQRGEPLRNLQGNRKSNGALGFLEDLLVRQTPRSDSTSLALKLKTKMSGKFLPTVRPTAEPQTFVPNIIASQKNTEQSFTFVPTIAPEDFTVAAESLEVVTAIDPENEDFSDYYDTTEPAIEYSYGNVNELAVTSIPHQNRVSFSNIGSRNKGNKLRNPIDVIVKTNQREVLSTDDSVRTEIEEFLSSQNGDLSYVEDDEITREDSTNEVLTPEPDLFAGGIFQPSIATSIQELSITTSAPSQPSLDFSPPNSGQVFHRAHHQQDHPHQPILTDVNSDPAHINEHIQGNFHNSVHRPLISHTAPITLRHQGVRHIVRPPVKATDSPRVSPPSALLRETLTRPPKVAPTRASRHETKAGNMRAIASSTASRRERNKVHQHREPKHHKPSINGREQFSRHHDVFSQHQKVLQQEQGLNRPAHSQSIGESGRNNPSLGNMLHRENRQPFGFQDRPFNSHHPTVFQRTNIFPIVPSQNQQGITSNGFRHPDNPHQNSRRQNLNNPNGLHQNGLDQSSHDHSGRVNHFAHLGSGFQRHEPNVLSHNDRERGPRREIFDFSNSDNLFTSTLEKPAGRSHTSLHIQSQSHKVTGNSEHDDSIDLQAKPVIMNVLISSINNTRIDDSNNVTSPFEKFMSKLKDGGLQSSRGNDNVTTFRHNVNLGLNNQQPEKTTLFTGPVLQITSMTQSFIGNKSSSNGTVQIPVTSKFGANNVFDMKNVLQTPHVAVKPNSNIHVRQHGTVSNIFTTPTIPVQTTKDSPQSKHQEINFSKMVVKPTTPRPWPHSLRASETKQNDETNKTGSATSHSLFTINPQPRIALENGNLNHDSHTSFQLPKQNVEQTYNFQQTSQPGQFLPIEINRGLGFGHEGRTNWHPIENRQQENRHIIQPNNKHINGQQLVNENHQQNSLLIRLNKSPHEQQIRGNQPPHGGQGSGQLFNAGQIPHDLQIQESQKQLIRQQPAAPFLNSSQSQATLRQAGNPLIPATTPDVRQTPADFQELGTAPNSNSSLATPRPGFLLPLSKAGNQVTKVTQLMEQGEVPGEPWLDYPAYTNLPSNVGFNCSHHVKDRRGVGHLFPDVDTRCQAYHLCQGGTRTSFLCPVGTIFNQVTQVCQWWFQVQCRQPFSAG